jgi:hypothetical protein
MTHDTGESATYPGHSDATKVRPSDQPENQFHHGKARYMTNVVNPSYMMMHISKHFFQNLFTVFRNLRQPSLLLNLC